MNILVIKNQFFNQLTLINGYIILAFHQTNQCFKLIFFLTVYLFIFFRYNYLLIAECVDLVTRWLKSDEIVISEEDDIKFRNMKSVKQVKVLNYIQNVNFFFFNIKNIYFIIFSVKNLQLSK